MEGKVGQSTELGKRGSSVPGAETSEDQGETQECRDFTPLSSGNHGAENIIPLDSNNQSLYHPRASLVKAWEQPRGWSRVCPTTPHCPPITETQVKPKVPEKSQPSGLPGMETSPCRVMGAL